MTFFHFQHFQSPAGSSVKPSHATGDLRPVISPQRLEQAVGLGTGWLSLLDDFGLKGQYVEATYPPIL